MPVNDDVTEEQVDDFLDQLMDLVPWQRHLVKELLLPAWRKTWKAVPLNRSASRPLWGVQRGIGPYMRLPDTQLAATFNRDQAQRWADRLNERERSHAGG